MLTFTSKRLYSFLLSTTGFLVVLIIWLYFSGKFNPLILPSPAATFGALQEIYVSGKLFTNLLITIRRTLIGYALAFLMGIVTALILNKNNIIRKILRPLITVIQTTPPIIWLALAVIWFGIAEDVTPIFLIFVVTFPIVFVNVSEGLQDIDENLVDMAQLYRATRKQIIIDIYYPALVPYLVSAMSIGLAFAWKSTVFAEFIGSASGVGFALSMANSNLETDKLFAWALVLVALMLIIEYVIIRPLQKKVSSWRQQS